ncbi:hypothetical protein F5Y17DRAFT_234314 [Xylariaceae sp. FL0594]|nr:hypothetical protein F5Y17DRAFT_234314 [Xylariaceae sp. FL0594]
MNENCDEKNKPHYAWLVTPANKKDTPSCCIAFPQLICFARCKPRRTHIPEDYLVTAGGCMNALNQEATMDEPGRVKIITAWCNPLPCSCSSSEKDQTPSPLGPLDIPVMDSEKTPKKTPYSLPSPTIIIVKPAMIRLGQVSRLKSEEGDIAVVEVDIFGAFPDVAVPVFHSMQPKWDGAVTAPLKICKRGADVIFKAEVSHPGSVETVPGKLPASDWAERVTVPDRGALVRHETQPLMFGILLSVERKLSAKATPNEKQDVDIQVWFLRSRHCEMLQAERIDCKNIFVVLHQVSGEIVPQK